MAAIQQPSPQSFLARPRFDGPPQDGAFRPRYPRYQAHHSAGRFRPPGFAGQINDSKGPRPWVEHRPGYTPHTTYNQGKQAKKSSHRKTIDYNATVLKTLQNRLYLKDPDESPAVLPDSLYTGEMTTPSDMRQNPINCVTTKFIRQSTNKLKCPIFTVAWTPEGRRLVTGASSGEFTLWNGLTFNFETILQAHDSSVRSMIWSHDDNWMMTGDHNGFVKYWQSNMNNVKMFQAHKEPIRGLSFCPTDNKFASCSDDGSVRIFDFTSCVEERLLKGHGADMRCVDWHPQKSIIISGSKDSQQPIKLWDARSGVSLATIHAHKSTVMSMKWNKNGNWFLTASRDHLLKLFDIRNMKSDFQTFKGHQKEATVVTWHPIYEDFFASGGSDGAIKFWSVGTDKEVGANDTAHDGFIWSMAWHPMGHILVTGSNDHSTKFWARNKPGDNMKDRYNLNLLPTEDEQEETTSSSFTTSTTSNELPGMGIDEDMIAQLKQANKDGIPGLDMDGKDLSTETFLQERKGKYMFIKKIDRSFAAAWEGRAQPPTQNRGNPSLLGDKPPEKPGSPPRPALLEAPDKPPNVWQDSKQPTGGLIQPPLSNHRSDFNPQGPPPGFPGRQEFNDRPPNDFRGGGPDNGPRRGDFSNGPRHDFHNGPRPDFMGGRNDSGGHFRPRNPGNNNFNGPRADFRGPRPNFRPRGPRPEHEDNRSNKGGQWKSPKGHWNGPGRGPNRPGPY